MLRACVPDSVSLRFEFSFHEWLKFRVILGSLSRMLRGAFQIGFSFTNGSSFELILGSFWSRMLRGAFQIGFRYVSNLVS